MFMLAFINSVETRNKAVASSSHKQVSVHDAYGKPTVAIFNKLIYIQFNIYMYVIFYFIFSI